MSEQIELFESSGPVNPNELSLMVHMLGQIGDWATAEVLLQRMRWPFTESNRRKLRQLAEASEGRIASAPGSPGYKLTHLVSPEELKWIEGIRSQCSRMNQRYIDIMRVWHSRRVPDNSTE